MNVAVCTGSWKFHVKYEESRRHGIDPAAGFFNGNRYRISEKGLEMSVSHADRARDLFLKGYNCAQAVLCAFSDVTGLDHETAMRLASPFGGGMARMREVCGSVSGAFMVLGMALGYTDPQDQEGKTTHYHMIQEYSRRFREKNGSITCRELLQGVSVTSGPDPEARTEEYYKKRPCPQLIWEAAGILDEMLEEYGIKGLQPTVNDLYRELTAQLIKKKLSVAMMESCTGGYLSSLFTDNEGASEVFFGSCVTYCNEEKIRQGVSSEVIRNHGVYSEETARAMAAASRASYGTTIGIGVTGTLGRLDPLNRDSVKGEVFFAIDREGCCESHAMSLSDGLNRPSAKRLVAAEVGKTLAGVLA